MWGLAQSNDPDSCADSGVVATGLRG